MLKINIIIEGPDAVGKSSLCDYICDLYDMKCWHSSSTTANDLKYHIDLLDNDNMIFDRFHVGEVIYPKIYHRKSKLDELDVEAINNKIKNNKDIFIIFYSSDTSILKQRLISRGEYSFLANIDYQNSEFKTFADKYVNEFDDNFIAVDIAEEDCYTKLYNKVEKLLTGASDIDVAYRQVCRDLLKNSHGASILTASRGNSNELNNYCFTVNDITNSVVSLKTRNTSLTYLSAETLWYWNARNDVDFIGKFAKLWQRISDDGKTNNSAYGYILQTKHGFNQINTIIDLLKRDKETRRAVLNINVPNENVATTKDEMCTIALNMYIRNDKLNCTAIMRSNDVIFGLTYDITYFIQLQKYIANKVGVDVGSYTHFATSMHYYDVDYDKVKTIANGPLTRVSERIDIDKLIANNDEIVNYVDNNFKDRDCFYQLLKDKGIIYDV